MCAMVPDSTKEVVRLARLLERQMARRRAAQRRADVLAAEIQATRKLLSDLTRPFSPGPFEEQCPHCLLPVSVHEDGGSDACAEAHGVKL